MIPLKLVGHFYVDGYGIVTTYKDGYGVEYSSVAQQIMSPFVKGVGRSAIVFDGYGETSLRPWTQFNPADGAEKVRKVLQFKKS